MMRKGHITYASSTVITLNVASHGCETWCCTFRDEQRLRVCNKKVLWKLFGSKMEKVTADWINFQSD